MKMIILSFSFVKSVNKEKNNAPKVKKVKFIAIFAIKYALVFFIMKFILACFANLIICKQKEKMCASIIQNVKLNNIEKARQGIKSAMIIFLIKTDKN